MALFQINSIKDLDRAIGIPAADLEQAVKTGELYGIKAPEHVLVSGKPMFKADAIQAWTDNLNIDCEGM